MPKKQNPTADGSRALRKALVGPSADTPNNAAPSKQLSFGYPPYQWPDIKPFRSNRPASDESHDRGVRSAASGASAAPNRSISTGMPDHREGAASPRTLQATPYRWPDGATLPTRQWLLGQWLLRGEVTAIFAPGGMGKSTIANTIALCLASGQPLLGKSLPQGAQGVWLFNLEDGLDELERQMAAACAYHELDCHSCGNRLYLDSGLIQPLCTAVDGRDGPALVEEVFEQLAAMIVAEQIAAIIVDPLVSSHSVQENNNGAIDANVKRWKRLAQETDCAVVLIHHTKKLWGKETTAEDGRGAIALRDAARVVLTLNGITKDEAQRAGIRDPRLARSILRIDVGKANRASLGAATWVKLESMCLNNGVAGAPSDDVGVASLWEMNHIVHDLGAPHLYHVQQALASGHWKHSAQAKDWVGFLVARIAGLSADDDRPLIKASLSAWFKSGALAVEYRRHNGRDVPCVVVGEAVDPAEIDDLPHLETCGAESAEGAESAAMAHD